MESKLNLIGQEKEVMKQLKAHKRGISQMQVYKFGITDLAGRICRLEEKGVKIDRVRVSVKDEDGKERTHYTRYILRSK